MPVTEMKAGLTPVVSQQNRFEGTAVVSVSTVPWSKAASPTVLLMRHQKEEAYMEGQQQEQSGKRTTIRSQRQSLDKPSMSNQAFYASGRRETR